MKDKKKFPHISEVMRPRWIKKQSKSSCGPRIIFKNNSIKYRRLKEFSEKEIATLQDKRYSIFDINGIHIIAISPKRALQTLAVTNYI